MSRITERKIRHIGKTVKEMIPENCGYAVFIFTFDKPGLCNYVSNGSQEQMINAISEIKRRSESGEVFKFNQN